MIFHNCFSSDLSSLANEPHIGFGNNNSADVLIVFPRNFLALFVPSPHLSAARAPNAAQDQGFSCDLERADGSGDQPNGGESRHPFDTVSEGRHFMVSRDAEVALA